MIKGSIHQEDITIINIYASHIRALKYRKQTLAERRNEQNSNGRRLQYPTFTTG